MVEWKVWVWQKLKCAIGTMRFRETPKLGRDMLERTYFRVAEEVLCRVYIVDWETRAVQRLCYGQPHCSWEIETRQSYGPGGPHP